MLVTDRAVYAGTLGQGLAIYNRASMRWTLNTTGLPSLNVTALAAVGAGYLLHRRRQRQLVRTSPRKLW